MKTIKLSLLITGLVLMSTNIFAQSQNSSNWCYTDQNYEEQATKNPNLRTIREEVDRFTANYIKNAPSDKQLVTIIIPVVVHNITHDGGQGSVTKADVDAQLAQLNKDFNRTNSDAANTRALFAPYASSINIEFRLAHKDPNGNCTEGIVRVESPLSYNPNPRDAVKAVSYWSSLKYFNIWVIDEISQNADGTYVAGYAQFPGQNNNGKYGVVLVNQNFGAGDRALTHEVGHCFNLYHTFQSGCFGGDACSDTPPQSQAFTGACNTNQNTCSNGGSPYTGNVVDQIENYMSYSSCQNMFSGNQVSRMNTILSSNSVTSGVAYLSTGANLNATGTNDPYNDAVCTPNMDFSSNKHHICEGASVSYSDHSWGSEATAWNWSFTGGTPSTSNSSNPTITYNTAGTFNTTLVASNSGGSNSKTINNIITVSSLTADYSGPVLDGFESTTTFNNDWRIESDGGQVWQNTNSAAATGSRSVRLKNYFTTVYRETDSLISPSYNLSVMSNPTFEFKVAYKRKNSSSNDRLFVYYSLDCGNSWTLQTLFSPTTMKTTPDQSSQFTPSNSSQWITKTVDISAVATESNVRFMFAFRADGGNNIFLDDININGPVGIDNFSKIGNFNVYPNPTSSNAQVSFSLINSVDNLTINVRNAVGQIVTNVISGQSFIAGSYNLKIDESRKLSKGIYFVEFTADGVSQVQKLIIQ